MLVDAAAGFCVRVRGKRPSDFPPFLCPSSIRRSAGCDASDRAAISPISVRISRHQTDAHDWRNARHAAPATEVSVRRSQQACFCGIFFFYLGLKFNCVFAVSAVAPVSDGTDV